MLMRSLSSTWLIIAFSACAIHGEELAVGPNAEAVVKHLFDEARSIKLGSTRRQAEAIFEKDAGLHNRVQGKYRMKKCRYIKVNISYKVSVSGDEADDGVSLLSGIFLETEEGH